MVFVELENSGVYTWDGENGIVLQDEVDSHTVIVDRHDIPILLEFLSRFL